MENRSQSIRNVRTLTTLGVLLALEIVLSRFLSIAAWNIKIGFSFVPVVVAAMLYGPVGAALVAGLGDLLGALLFPIGPYFPGFTFTAVLTGLTFGFLLHKKCTLPNTLLAVGIVQFVLGLFLNSYWISVLYGSPYGPLLATRVVQSALLSVVQVVTIRLLAELPKRFAGRLAV
ncbi:MAG: folate family ECF transporter S component [Ruminococcaceae bacterium]|jgi:ECF transporter S component (folate family)|nr:folate family ECF transporter S component [Oscillospiraceae bacterium]